MKLPDSVSVTNGLDTVTVSLISRPSQNERTDLFVSAENVFNRVYMFLDVTHARELADALLAYAEQADRTSQAKGTAS